MAERHHKTITNATGAFPRASHREWIGLGVIALACLLYSLDATVLYLALPQISSVLKPNSSQFLWIVDIYGFLLAGSLIPMGVLGNRIGRRRLLLIGAAAFGLCSLAAAFSTSALMLIAARALQGIAAATLAPSTLSLIRNMFLDPKQRTFAIGLWAASFSVGAAIGPLIGGVLLTHFWWGSVFLVAVPVMLLLLVLGPRLLPEYRDHHVERLDLVSAALSLFSVLAVIYGIKQLAQDGAGWLWAIVILAGLALFVVFIIRQRRLSHPLLDLRLFRLPIFRTSLALNTLGFFVTFAAFLFLAQYLQLVLGMGPWETGLWMLPSSVGLVVGSLLAPLFILGSVSKSITALAVMQLVESGFVKLDGPVQKYLPWFHLADPTASRQITIQELLNQTSDLPTSAEFAALAGTGTQTLEQYVHNLNNVALASPPGTTYHYSNSRKTS